jgi:hypothetical protein
MRKCPAVLSNACERGSQLRERSDSPIGSTIEHATVFV